MKWAARCWPAAASVLICVAAGAQSPSPGWPPGPAIGIRLRLSSDIAGTASPSADPAAAARAAATDADLARLLAQPQRCADTLAAGPTVGPTADPSQATAPLHIGAVLQAVICRQAGVRRGTGLTTQAQAALDLARAARQPSLGVSAGIDAESGYTTSWATSLRLDWVLFDFGSRGAALRQAREALAAVIDEQRIEVLTALGDAATLFAAAQAASARLESAAINLRTAEDSSNLASARHGAGAATLVEKLQAQTALAQARLEHARAGGLRQAAVGALAVAMGLPANQAIELAPRGADTHADTEVEADLSIDLPALIAEARQRHPRVVAARERLAEATARAGAVRAGRWGDVTLSARAGQTRYGGNSELQRSTSATVQWSVPLFDRGVLASRLDDARGQVQVRGAAVDDALSQVEGLVWQQGQALQSDRAVLRESRLVQDSAEQARLAAVERYRAGVGAFSDVLAAQNVAANARFQWVEAQANVRRANLRLAAAIGRFGALRAD